MDVVVSGGTCSFRLRVSDTDYLSQPGDRVHYTATGESNAIAIIGFAIGDVGSGSLWASDTSTPAEPGLYQFARVAIKVAPGQGYWEESVGSLTVTIAEYEPHSRLVGMAEGTVVIPDTDDSLPFTLEFVIVDPSPGLFSYGCDVTGPDEDF